MTADNAVDQVLGLVPPDAGQERPFVLGIDGRSGAGKTELARAVADRIPGSQVVVLEDAYRGWSGLRAGVVEVAEGVLRALRQGRAGSYTRYDWVRGELDGSVRVEPSAVVVLEGCGAGALPCLPYLDALVWLEAPEDARRHRAMERDAAAWADRWATWAAQESALLAEHDARAAADLVIRTA